MRYHAKELIFHEVIVSCKRGVFADLRIMRDSVPEGVYLYEVRHDDDGKGDPVEIAKGILVNFYGTLLMREKLEQVEKNGYQDIEDDGWVNISVRGYSLEEYMRRDAIRI